MASGGFSFCGIDIKDLDLEYAPEMEDTYVYRPAETNTHIETYEGHNGGYIYGAWKQPKEFTLRCFFEEEYIDRGIMAQVYSLFKVGRTGKLVFARRPWVYYYATVTDPVEEGFTNYKNGLITIRMKAMYPYARSDITTNIYTDPFHDVIIRNSAVFDREDMELPTEYNLTEQKTIILANTGTERAALGFEISGDVGTGVTIANSMTKQSCKMVAISKALTTDVNKKVLLDPISGKTILVGNGSKELAFLYHQYGFLELAPSFPAVRDLFVDYASESTEVNVTNILHQNLIGKYLFVDGSWKKIYEQPDEHSLVVSSQATSTAKERTTAMLMNEITITPDTTMDIKINFIFKPTYA